MAEELELKAVVTRPAEVRANLRAAGATRGFAGLMRDRRYDSAGELLARDEVLRVREYHHPDGSQTAQLTWKGPTRRSADGYKQREELELAVEPVRGSPAALLEALGYRPVHAIDRWVEMWSLAGGSARFEWYPRMDVLLEVEGEPESIERTITATGMERAAFTAESLSDFAGRYDARGGHAVLALSELGEGRPSWEHRDVRAGDA